MFSWLWNALRRLLTYPPVLAVLATLLLFALHKKAVLLVHEIIEFLPAPPPSLLSELPPDEGRETLLAFLAFVAAAVYLAWHFRPGWLAASKPFRTLVVLLCLSIAALGAYRFALPAWLTCDYVGERYLLGLYYTPHGREYAKDHSCAVMIRDHPGVLDTLMTPESVLWSQAVYSAAFLVVFLLILLTLIQILETLLLLAFNRHHGG
jgi:hypothetical protein